MIIADLIILGVAVYLSLYILYWLVLFSARFLIRDQPDVFRIQKTRFAIVVPAHNEELFLARLLKSIHDQDYPANLYKGIVIADNCSDRTAEIALENGARVFERVDPSNWGKGYAVKYALEKINPTEYDAVLIVDADSIVENGCLKALDHALQNGEKVIQCYNGVLNPDESWFTRLLDVSRTIGNEIIHPGKVKLGLSSYLMGNGMCFSRQTILEDGWKAFTVGEDWEYYAMLIEKGGRVSFAKEARVFHQESVSLKQATSQRMRWSSGRFAVLGKFGFRLLYRGLQERSWIKAAGSLPLIFPNPSLAMNLTLISVMASFVILPGSSRDTYIVWFAALGSCQFLIFTVGIFYTKQRWKKFLSIFIAPIFLVWKMGIDLISALGFGRGRWIRTERRR